MKDSEWLTTKAENGQKTQRYNGGGGKGVRIGLEGAFKYGFSVSIISKQAEGKTPKFIQEQNGTRSVAVLDDAEGRADAGTDITITGPIASTPIVGEELTEESLQAFAAQAGLNSENLANLLPVGEVVTQQYLDDVRILGRLLALGPELEYGLRSTLTSAEKRFYGALSRELFNFRLPDSRQAFSSENIDRLARTLIAAKEGSLRILNAINVLSDDELDIFMTRDGAQREEAFKGLSQERKGQLFLRLADVVNTYEGYAQITKLELMKRLIPMSLITLISQYYSMSNASVIFAVKAHNNFHIWIPLAKTKVLEIQDQVGGNRNAWFIVGHQGLSRVDDWITVAQEKVLAIQDRVGGSTRAWAIVIMRNMKNVDAWVNEAEVKVEAIQSRVGGAYNAWSIVTAQGVNKVDPWLRDAERTVLAIQGDVGGPSKAWDIVINQGTVNAEKWVKEASAKVRTIQDQVYGPGNAWVIVTTHGIKNTDAWVQNAREKIPAITNKVGAASYAWIIVIGQGLQNADAWVTQAQMKVVEIQDQVGGAGRAWGIVINQGINNTDKWIQEAKLRVSEIAGQVGGVSNAWRIVISKGFQNADAWIEKAKNSVMDLMREQKSSAEAWRQVIENTLEDNTSPQAVASAPVLDVERPEDVGGIDMNAKALDLQTEGDGIKFDMPFDPTQLQNIQIDGFSPVILQIIPTNLPLFIGIKDTDESLQVSSIK
ncbi:MAG: hypothetical protein IT395_07610 [Candidatus Omnitrophica bacterium]|nr:hypothetical protein [Candidatus Omnitrophota bacterium]